MLLLYSLIQTNKVPSVAVNVLCDFFRSPPQSSEVPSFFLPRICRQMNPAGTDLKFWGFDHMTWRLSQWQSLAQISA